MKARGEVHNEKSAVDNPYSVLDESSILHPSSEITSGLPLHSRILIGLAIGVVSGITVNILSGGDHPRVVWVVSNVTEPIGTLFLRLLLMIVVPLVFSSLVVGVAGIGDIRRLGRVGLKSFLYTFIISAISVVIGLSLTKIIRPGNRIDPATAACRGGL
jgi:DAACS family dicarboxylate/amino acid:cation (Na+ or H+) symporter